MYLHSLRVHYLKLLEDLQLSFENSDGSPRLWTLIIGKNGTAKTSILQAIALAAIGQLQVNSLARPVVGHLRDRRRGTAVMRVTADFGFDADSRGERSHPTLGRTLSDGERLRSGLELRPNSTTLRGRAFYVDSAGSELPTGDDPLVEARAANRAHWFVAGYGVSRFLPDPAQRPVLDNPAVDRLQPLFTQLAGLTSLRFVDHFPGKAARQYVKLLRDILTRVHELVPDLQNIELRGAGGVSRAGQLIEKDRFKLRVGSRSSNLPAVALSHGYQSTIAWIADLVGHIILEHGPDIDASAMCGLVLIDEIDLYLHPSWQAGLVPALRETFPRVQFVATTHSPVVLSSLESDEIVRVGQDPESGSVARWGRDYESGELVPWHGGFAPAIEPDPRTMTGTELYRAWFGVDRLVLNPAGAVLREWLRIATDPYRTDEEDRELSALSAKLRRASIEPPRDPVPRDPS